MKEMEKINDATKAQIVKIQCFAILKYVCKVIECGDIRDETIDKVQKLFDIVK